MTRLTLHLTHLVIAWSVLAVFAGECGAFASCAARGHAAVVAPKFNPEIP